MTMPLKTCINYMLVFMLHTQGFKYKYYVYVQEILVGSVYLHEVIRIHVRSNFKTFRALSVDPLERLLAPPDESRSQFVHVRHCLAVSSGGCGNPAGLTKVRR
jgi:hypothetical protein